MSHTGTVQKIYEAFGQGNIPAILECVSPSVEWEYGVNSTDVPWLQPRRGREGVVEFFQALGGALEVTKFQPKVLLEQGNLVVALTDFEATVKATGRQIVEEDDVHIWYFDSDGLVSRFRHRIDTHHQYEAYHGR